MDSSILLGKWAHYPKVAQSDSALPYGAPLARCQRRSPLHRIDGLQCVASRHAGAFCTLEVTLPDVTFRDTS